MSAPVRVRDVATPNALFRQEIDRIGGLLLAEATRHLPTREVRVMTPLTETGGRVLATQPVVVPVLRAGLGFLAAAQQLFPNCDIGFIGVSRDEATHMPKPYVNKLPEHLGGRQCIVLDPMLATGGSLTHTVRLLLDRGATANAKPELEIYADDVKCAHGATVGELDPQQLFYAAARGMDPATAKAVLLEGFIGGLWDSLGEDSDIAIAARESLREVTR